VINIIVVLAIIFAGIAIAAVVAIRIRPHPINIPETQVASDVDRVPEIKESSDPRAQI
jgi:hypothetical protein